MGLNEPICISGKFDTKQKRSKSGSTQSVIISNDSWIRNGIRFKVRKYDHNTFAKDVIAVVSSFCQNFSLKEMAMQEMEDVDSNHVILALNKITGEIIGFCIYSFDNFVFNRDLSLSLEHATNLSLITFSLENMDYMPKKQKSKWVATVVELIKQYFAINLTMVYVGFTTPNGQESSEYFVKKQAFTKEAAVKLTNLLQTNNEIELLKKMDMIISWITEFTNMLTLDHNRTQILEEGSVVNLYLHLTCVKPNYASYGVLKGMLRYLTSLVVKKCKKIGTNNGYITLHSLPERREMYESFGFVRNIVSELTIGGLMSPNLIKQQHLFKIYS